MCSIIVNVELIQDSALRGLVTDGLVGLVDSNEHLSMWHTTEDGETHPLARHYRGYVLENTTGKTIVKGEADWEDVVLDETSFSNLVFENLYEAKQVTKLRLFEYKGQVYLSTHQRLNAYESFWGIHSRSFGSMVEEYMHPEYLGLVASDPAIHNVEYGCTEVYLEARDNQFVVNLSDPFDGITKLYTTDTLVLNQPGQGEGLYSLPVAHGKYTSLAQDIYLVDPVHGIRYLSPSMHYKLNTLRNTHEPNLIRRFFVLKGHGRNLLDVLPSDQASLLRGIVHKKQQLIQKLGHSIDSFNKLPGLEQYKLIAKEL